MMMRMQRRMAQRAADREEVLERRLAEHRRFVVPLPHPEDGDVRHLVPEPALPPPPPPPPPFPLRYGSDDSLAEPSRRAQNLAAFDVALRAAASLGATEGDAAAAAARLAAAHSARVRAQFCAAQTSNRRWTSRLLIPGVQDGVRAAYTAVQRACEAEATLQLALLPPSIVQPAVPESTRLLLSAEALAGLADGLAAAIKNLVATPEPEAPAALANVQQMSQRVAEATEEMLRTGRTSLLARCGGAEAARARRLALQAPAAEAPAVEAPVAMMETA